MKKLHLAISSANIEKTVADYTIRLQAKPCLVIPGEYVLWRTASLNLSVRRDADSKSGELRHLGWEDPSATAFDQDVDVNGIIWERFTARQQADEINALWPDVNYHPAT